MDPASSEFGAIRTIADAFNVPGKLVEVEPFGGGHINDSYKLAYARRAKSVQQWNELRCYILQRINSRVFPAPERLMENMVRVITHVATAMYGRAAAEVAAGRGRGCEPWMRVLILELTHFGLPFHVDANM